MSVLHTIHRVFPPPQYISFPSVGVDISDTSLKYVQFDRARARDVNLQLKYWGDIDIPVGVIERGNVHDVAKLTQVLKEVRQRTKCEYVRVSLPEERAYLFETSIGRNTPRKDIRGCLLEFKLEENVPLSPRDAYFDYDVVGTNTQGNEIRVAVAVYARDTINNYYEACMGARVIPLSFEIEAQAIARASVDTRLSGTYMIVDFGKTRMGVGIVHKGVLMYTSTIDVAGQHMSASMRAVLGDLPESELTKIKNTKGIVNTKDNAVVYEALKGAAHTIADELGIRIHYWHTRDIDRGERQIQKIILCGGSANLFGLPEYLTEELTIPTERATVWQNAFALDTFVPPIGRKYSYGYATAIGLALKDFVV
jgi:type IV pilus assembly protein PilM